MFHKLQEALGFHFQDETLLRHALCHSSYANENKDAGFKSNERLEFLGDAVLGFVTADYLYRKYSDCPEGELTRMRAELVCEESLARGANEIRLGEHLFLGHGEEHGGGRNRESILADAMESVFAAAYLDSGFDAAAKMIHRLILNRHVKKHEITADYKTVLQELVQRTRNQQLQYELISEAGPDHEKVFEIRVLCNGRLLGTGRGTSKKRAEQAAAHAAILAFYPNEISNMH